jgi:outer membrane protein assembly factor BamB
MNTNDGIHKLDDEHFITTGSQGLTIRRISNGQWVSSLNTPNRNRLPGSGTYFGGHFSTSMKMYFNHAYDTDLRQAQIVAHDVSDPLNPVIAWIYPMDQSGELLCSGDGKVYVGSTEGKIFAINENGTRVWNAPTLGGIAQQSGIYYEGKVFAS